MMHDTDVDDEFVIVKMMMMLAVMLTYTGSLAMFT